MSKIALTPNASGTGTFTIASPNSNTDRTLTLPDVAGEVVVNEGSGTFKIDSSGNVGIGTSSPAAALDVNGEAIAMSGSSTEDRAIEIGAGRTGNGNSYVDLISDTTYTDFGARFIRHNSGPNAGTTLEHRGTGELALWAADAGAVKFGTSNTERMRIDSSGRITTPSQPSIYLEGNYGNQVNFTAGQQYLVSTYYNQAHVRGGMSWNSGTGRVTVPTAGQYLLTFAGYENGGSGRVQIRKNASLVNIVQWFNNGTNGESFTLQMSANDYIDIIADGFDLPQTYMGNAHTHFSLNLLG